MHGFGLLVIPDRLVDTDVHATQIGETTRGDVEGTVPVDLVVFVAEYYVQVEVLYGKSF